MKILGTAAAVALCAVAAPRQPAAPSPSTTVTEIANIRFVSDPLVNLHHVLFAAAWARRPNRSRSLASDLPVPLVAPLSDSERAAWDAAIDYYDKNLADQDLLRDRRMNDRNNALMTGDLAAASVGTDLRAVLERALPIYQKHFWPVHDRDMRAWTADTVERVKSIAADVIPRLEKIYASRWFDTPVRADVVWVGSREGAYTTLQPIHATISIADKEWAGAEIVFHEFSHVLVIPLQQRLLRAIGDRRQHGVLWHVIQFYLTGEIVRDALKPRGIAYTPYMYMGLFDRAWPQYRRLVETEWQPYLNGKATLDAAIAATVAGLPSP